MIIVRADEMQKQLDEKGEVILNFCVQLQTDKEKMPLNDASVVWDPKLSPFIKVATLRITKQEFRTAERSQMAVWYTTCRKEKTTWIYELRAHQLERKLDKKRKTYH